MMSRITIRFRLVGGSSSLGDEDYERKSESFRTSCISDSYPIVGAPDPYEEQTYRMSQRNHLKFIHSFRLVGIIQGTKRR